MKLQKKDKLYDLILEEWANMHHNASILSHWPDFKNDYEADLFWACLADDVSLWIDDLQELVKEKFGHDWKFYSYGRTGATIAPDNIMRSVGGNGFGGLRLEAIPEDYKDMLNFYHALQFINKYWHDTARSIPEWWNETKEANGYQEDIDDHDGMHAVMRQVWVKN